MFFSNKQIFDGNSELLENIRRDIKNQLYEKGVMISGINIDMNSENISFSIFIQGLPVKRKLNTN